MQFDFKGKVAVVTGAGRGIGRAIAERLVESGAKVIAVSKSEDKLRELAAECPSITIIPVDLGHWDEAKKKLGHMDNIDFLINNAATSDSIHIADIKQDQVDRMMDVNVKSCINLTQIVLPGMVKRKFGAIVNISSVSSMCAFDGHSVYGMTKSALDYFTKQTATEYGKYNVRCNAVNPTVVWTEMGQAFWSEEEKSAAMKARIPTGRFVAVHEVVEPVLFLLTDGAAMVNGVTLPIDGGLTARG